MPLFICPLPLVSCYPSVLCPLLLRTQFEQIFSEKVPWLERAAISRLASAYDPHRSGVIKFVRVTAALMVGNRPAMSFLMAQLTRDPDNIDKTGNVFLLRLLHGLYEDCDGGVVEQAISSMERPSFSSAAVSTSGQGKGQSQDKGQSQAALNVPRTEGAGVKLEDVAELLCAACSSLEEEIEMQRLAEEAVQVLFEEGQRKDLAAVSSSAPNSRRRPLTTRSSRRGLSLPSFLLFTLFLSIRAAALWGHRLSSSRRDRAG
jgi:hypothetical protein